MDIHNLRRKPHSIIFNVSAASMPHILFIVSVIFSYVEFLPEKVRSVVIVERSQLTDSTATKLSDLYYTKNNVFNNFELLKINLSNS